MDQSLISNKLRSVISLVDKLRDINLQSYIKLPKIVAVGSQSSGKSSLVQQIVGLDFLPRGSGVVTRRPLEIRMIYQKDLQKPYAQFAQIPQKMTDFNKVKRSIEQLTDKVCGTKKNIIDKPIILDVYSSNCPNLTIIDLPGLTRIAIDGQTANIHAVTTDMIRKYMEQPTTIILCVIPANQDITNDQVLHMARKIDVTGQRTIGCITKIDIMDRGTDARSLLMNKGEVPLKLGYVGIKNRSQQDINLKRTVQQSLENQKMYFSKSPIYSSLPIQCLGTSSLVLTENICKFLPQLTSKIKQRKSKLQQIVKSYGRPLPKTQQEKQSLLWQMCSQFMSEYKKCLVGQISVLKCQQNLLKTATHIQNELNICLQEQFNIKPVQLLTDNKIQFAIKKFEGSNMPGFPSISAFLYLLNPLLTSIKLPVEQTLNNIFDQLLHIIELIISEIAHQYLQFREHLNQKLGQILSRYRKNSREFIQSMLEAQLNYIYTNNPSYDMYMEQHSKKQVNQRIIVAPSNPMAEILRRRIDAYYKVVIKNLRDLAPKNIKYSLIIQATKTIQFQIFQIVNQTQKTDEFLKIGQASKTERMRNQQQYDVLCKTEQYILTHSGLGGYKEADNKKRLILRQQEIDQANKKRQQKQKQKQQIKQAKLKEEQTPKKQDKKGNGAGLGPQDKNQNTKIQSSPGSTGSFFQNFFGKKTQIPKQVPKQPVRQPVKQVKIDPKSVPPTAANTTNNSPLNTQQPKKKTNFGDIFGLGGQNKTQVSKPPPIPSNPAQKQQQKPSNNFTDVYNKQMGKATDKAVDNLYANEQFKQKSKQAVADGTSLAAQKKLGVCEQTGKTLGKGAAWLFGTDMAQNYLKQETKKNIKNQTQLPK